MRGKLTPGEVRSAIRKVCEEKNYDPFRELIELATQTTEVVLDGEKIRVKSLDVEQRISIAKEVAQYLAPKLKNIEVKADVDLEVKVSIKDYSGALPVPVVPKQIEDAVEIPIVSAEEANGN